MWKDLSLAANSFSSLEITEVLGGPSVWGSYRAMAQSCFIPFQRNFDIIYIYIYIFKKIAKAEQTNISSCLIFFFGCFCWSSSSLLFGTARVRCCACFAFALHLSFFVLGFVPLPLPFLSLPFLSLPFSLPFLTFPRPRPFPLPFLAGEWDTSDEASPLSSGSACLAARRKTRWACNRDRGAKERLCGT